MCSKPLYNLAFILIPSTIRGEYPDNGGAKSSFVEECFFYSPGIFQSFHLEKNTVLDYESLDGHSQHSINRLTKWGTRHKEAMGFY